jgi:hypothetical protein
MAVAKLLDKVQESPALVGRRREAAQSGGAGLANPDAPLAAPRLAELLKPTQGLIRGCHGSFASFVSFLLHRAG